MIWDRENNFLKILSFMLFDNYLFLGDYNHKHGQVVKVYTFQEQPFLKKKYQILERNQVMYFYLRVIAKPKVLDICLFLFPYYWVI